MFDSVANEFDQIVARGHRGDKGVAATAAVLIFITMPNATRQRFVDVIKLAEGRGLDGSILDAAKRLCREDGLLNEPDEGDIVESAAAEAVADPPRPATARSHPSASGGRRKSA